MSHILTRFLPRILSTIRQNNPILEITNRRTARYFLPRTIQGTKKGAPSAVKDLKIIKREWLVRRTKNCAQEETG